MLLNFDLLKKLKHPSVNLVSLMTEEAGTAISGVPCSPQEVDAFEDCLLDMTSFPDADMAQYIAHTVLNHDIDYLLETPQAFGRQMRAIVNSNTSYSWKNSFDSALEKVHLKR